MKTLKGSSLYYKARAVFGNANISVTDSEYALPSEKWITGKFYHNFNWWMQSNGVKKWKTYTDCDNKAFAYFVCANISHAKTMEARERASMETYEGIAVGVMFYLIDGKKTSGHAINVVYTNGKLIYIEPQNGEQLKLTKKEIDSCWYVTF